MLPGGFGTENDRLEIARVARNFVGTEQTQKMRYEKFVFFMISTDFPCLVLGLDLRSETGGAKKIAGKISLILFSSLDCFAHSSNGLE